MLPEEDEAPQSDHSVELVTDMQSPFPTRRRRIAQVAVGFCMLGACGLIALAVQENRRANEEERTLESVQSTEVQDGWKTLGAVAAQQARATDAQNAAAQPVAAPTVTPPAAAPATTNIVIVNPPSQPARNPVPTDAPAAPSMTSPSPGVSNGVNTVYVPTPVLPSVTPDRNIPGQNLSNGSVTGSQANPALQPGSSTGDTPSTPVGGVPASPPSTDLSP